MVAKVYPCYHSRKGQPTNFGSSILFKNKIHTIRSNYPLWEKRIKLVQEGKAVLVLKQWVGRPYHTSQEILITLTKDDIVGIQKLEFIEGVLSKLNNPIIKKEKGYIKINPLTLSRNDGLEILSFQEWFKPYDLNEPMAIIHFTDFRYE